MLRIENPNATTASPVTAQDKTDIQAALAALSSTGAPTFDQVRAALSSGKRARFTDGMIHQTALELGLDVIV